MHGHPLPRLAAHVVDRPVPHVLFPEKSHVDERHATHAVAENEQVAGQRQRTRNRQVEALQTGDEPLVDGPFARAVDARIDTAERRRRLGQPPADRLVVNRAQDAHVERHGVPDDPAAQQVSVVLLDQPLGERGERQLAAAEKARKTVERARVVAGRAQPVVGRQLRDLLAHERRHTHAARQCAEAVGDVVDRIGPPLAVQVADDPAQQVHVARYAALPDRDAARLRGDGPLRRSVPLAGQQADVGRNAADPAETTQLIVDGSGLAGHARCAEFYLYGSDHNSMGFVPKGRNYPLFRTHTHPCLIG